MREGVRGVPTGSPPFRKVIVCGGRDFVDWDWLNEVLNAMHAIHSFTHIIHGDAYGADTLAENWAIDHGVQDVACPANWKQWPVAAGPIRNQAMLDLGADAVIAFPGGKGTADMVSRARRRGVPVIKPEKGVA